MKLAIKYSLGRGLILRIMTEQRHTRKETFKCRSLPKTSFKLDNIDSTVLNRSDEASKEGNWTRRK